MISLLALIDLRSTYVFQNRISGGLVALGLLALFGLRFLIKGMRDDIYDYIGERYAPRWSYIAFGLGCQLPFIAFLVFLRHQAAL
ncbi:MAG: hypothetical protein QM796_15490 [Chthoniobacteraceae bacterium]